MKKKRMRKENSRNGLSCRVGAAVETKKRLKRAVPSHCEQCENAVFEKGPASIHDQLPGRNLSCLLCCTWLLRFIAFDRGFSQAFVLPVFARLQQSEVGIFLQNGMGWSRLRKIPVNKVCGSAGSDAILGLQLHSSTV